MAGIADLIRSAVSTADALTKSVQEPVVHRVWRGQDGFGVTRPKEVTRNAIVEQKLHRRRMSDGTLVECKAKLTFLEPIAADGSAGRTEPVDANDRFVLADGSVCVVVDVEGMRNPNVGPFLLEVYLGNER